MSLNVREQDALRDHFAAAAAQGYQWWRWGRMQPKAEVPDQITDLLAARACWRFADAMLATREVTRGEVLDKHVPCPECGFFSMPWSDNRRACLRCRKDFPYVARVGQKAVDGTAPPG